MPVRSLTAAGPPKRICCMVSRWFKARGSSFQYGGNLDAGAKVRPKPAFFSGAHYVNLTCPCSIPLMADMHELDNDRARAASSEDDILGKLDYWRSVLHERGLHTEAMVMGCAASTIKILRGQVREKLPKRRA